jgi:hypothetical protein
MPYKNKSVSNNSFKDILCQDIWCKDKDNLDYDDKKFLANKCLPYVYCSQPTIFVAAINSNDNYHHFLLKSQKTDKLMVVSHIWQQGKFTALKADDVDILLSCVNRFPVVFDDIGDNKPFWLLKNSNHDLVAFRIWGKHHLPLSGSYAFDAQLDMHTGIVSTITNPVDIELVFNSGCVILADINTSDNNNNNNNNNDNSDENNYVGCVVYRSLLINDKLTVIGELCNGKVTVLTPSGIKLCKEQHKLNIDHTVLKTPGIYFTFRVDEHLVGDNYDGYDSDRGDVEEDVEYNNVYNLELFFPYMKSIPSDHERWIRDKIDKDVNIHQHIGDYYNINGTEKPREITSQSLTITGITAIDHNGNILLIPKRPTPNIRIDYDCEDY